MRLREGFGRVGAGVLTLLPAGAGVLALLACTCSVARAAATGTIDTAFGAHGFVVAPVGTWAVAAGVAVQSDGKIVTAGEAEVSGQDVIVSTRMTSTGRLDKTYGHGGIVTVAINGGAGVDSGAGIALQQDGKIVIAGSGRDGSYGPLSFAAVRLTTRGALDRTFGQGGITTVAIGSYSIANAVVIEPNGEIDLAGTALESHNEFAAARLRPDGSLDTGFGTDGITTVPSQTGAAWALVRQRDGKLVLAGQADYANPLIAGAQQFMAVRLNSDGTPDSGFGQEGISLVPAGGTSLGFGVVQTGDGKLVLAGPAWTGTNVNATARLTTSGQLDPSYGSNGIYAIPDAYGANGMLLDPDGRFLLPAVGPSIQRLNQDGSPDQGFGSGGLAVTPYGENGAANGAAVQSDGKIVLAGATSINNRTEVLVERLR